MRTGTTCILIDCGFSRKELLRRLASRRIDPSQIDAVLITHEHGDHYRAAAQLAKQDGISIYMSSGTGKSVLARSGYSEFLKECSRTFDSQKPFRIGDLTILPIVVPHDTAEPTQFVVRKGNRSFGILTDCGSITSEIVEHYSDVNALLLESNHDLELLMNGPYPIDTKARVKSDYGHLNNEQARDFFDEIASPRLTNLVVGHISLNNNSVEHVRSTFHSTPEHVDVTYATQESGTGWISV